MTSGQATMTSQECSGMAREEPREMYVVDMRGRVTSEMCVLFRGHNNLNFLSAHLFTMGGCLV